MITEMGPVIVMAGEWPPPLSIHVAPMLGIGPCPWCATSGRRLWRRPRIWCESSSVSPAASRGWHLTDLDRAIVDIRAFLDPSAEPLPSGHTSRWWGVGIKRPDGSVAIEPDPSPDR
jgi:hypothetical protein